MVAQITYHPIADISPFTFLLKYYNDLISFYPNFKISIVRRQANCVNHDMAGETLFIASHQSYYYSPHTSLY